MGMHPSEADMGIVLFLSLSFFFSFPGFQLAHWARAWRNTRGKRTHPLTDRSRPIREAFTCRPLCWQTSLSIDAKCLC